MEAALLASLLAAREGCDGNVSLSADIFPTDSTQALSEATLTHAAALPLERTFQAPEFALHTHRQIFSAEERHALWHNACGSRPLHYDYGYLQSDACAGVLNQRAVACILAVSVRLLAPVQTSCDLTLIGCTARSTIAHGPWRSVRLRDGHQR